MLIDKAVGLYKRAGLLMEKQTESSGNGSKTKIKKDIQTLKPGMFNWSEGQRVASLTTTYEAVVGKMEGSIEWYRTKRSSKRKLAWCFRVGAIVLGAIAAAMPTVAEIAYAGVRPADWWLRPSIATILAILVGALIMMDKLIGASTAWIRYTMAETALKELQDELAIAYLLESGKWAGEKEKEPSLEQAKSALTVLQTFLSRANQIVRDETNQWKAEFQSALALTEEYAKSQPKKVEEAAVTVKLSNPDRLAGAWTVSVNGGTEWTAEGDSKSFQLTPGVVRVSVKATVKAGAEDKETKPFATETSDVLAAGAVKTIPITLPPKQT